MFEFRKELEKIREVKRDYYKYEAESFLERTLHQLNRVNSTTLKCVVTLDFSCKTINGEEYICVAMNKNNEFFAKSYIHHTAKIVFERISTIITENGYFVIRDNEHTFHFEF